MLISSFHLEKPPKKTVLFVFVKKLLILENHSPRILVNPPLKADIL